MPYSAAKLLHLAGLVLWLGPSTGGYILIVAARLRGDDAAELWLLGEYLTLIYIEAAGLLILVTSGAVMLAKAPALRKAGWLRLKLAIVFSVFIPLEAAQLVIYRLRVAPALEADAGVEPAVLLFDRFSLVAGAVLAVAIPLVFYLALFRPGGRAKGP